MSDVVIDFSVVVHTLAIYAAVVIIPGANLALVSRLALKGNRPASHGAIAGMATAATFYAVLAMIGLAALLNEIAWLARILQVLGGCYLIYIGLGAWRASFQSKSEQITRLQKQDHTYLSGFYLGCLVNLSNPKAIAFFVGLYALAVPPDASITTRAVVLIGGAMIEFLWYGLVVEILSKIPSRRTYDAAGKLFERMIGSILILLGAQLLLNR